ncbi:MAG TPA: helix-turn-helix transcriptional regulator [Solirubrobacteraceae bacterium]|jgi:transcriptional regulator with XRE-family HTH domain|nr:helix-turn-helix transcriptional regulator [Solirubrobacteraceae bacterium]
MPHPEDANLALGVAIRRIRERRATTQEALAHEAQVTTGTLSKLERGQTTPTWSTVVKIAAALGISLRDLGGEIEREP